MLFNRAKHKHEAEFQQSGKVINDKVRLYYLIGNALLEAKQAGANPFAAIETVISWDDFTQSLSFARVGVEVVVVESLIYVGLVVRLPL